MMITGTIFLHKNIHKYTWTSPDSITNNQIDHILVNGKYRRSILDTKAERGADIGSDHQLVIS
jgi:endonuclease/exonuclease/phosphatase family metal-dependent hydrolase